MKIIRDGLYLCMDCMVVSCNGAHGVELTDMKATLDGLDKLGPYLVPDFDAEDETGILSFSSIPCAACETHLAGYRARFAILGEDKRTE